MRKMIMMMMMMRRINSEDDEDDGDSDSQFPTDSAGPSAEPVIPAVMKSFRAIVASLTHSTQDGAYLPICSSVDN